jgi:hypothetical protein
VPSWKALACGQSVVAPDSPSTGPRSWVGRAGNRERTLTLLDAARGPFESIGMPGWLRRAEELRQQLER